MRSKTACSGNAPARFMQSGEEIHAAEEDK